MKKHSSGNSAICMQETHTTEKSQEDFEPSGYDF